MTNDLVTIEVDGKALQARKGAMLIEATDDAGIYIPRFCYHKKLSVAANCRMCLVEVEKAPKPLPACATPVMDGMKVSTRSPQALDAQKATMEFLLINHPLDCPICDQGGECELQDLAMDYGSDVSRYTERKRVVKDKDIGPLIQTDMTRCIHCTRCVRFGDEVAGLKELGVTGRGEHMQIGTYIEKAVRSEMSGNVIDLCPVGALTSKPYRYSARAWELRQRDGIAPHDCVGSNIHLHIKDGRVKRVVPRDNEAVNETWISDRDRYSYEGLYSDDRLTTPMIKEDGKWRETDWETALKFAAQALKRTVETHRPDQLGALTTPSATLEELFLLQKLTRALGSDNIDHRLHQFDFSDQEQAPLFPWLGQSLADIESVNAALLIGSDLRKEQPIVNHRLRKATLRGAKVMAVNPLNYEFNYDLARYLVVPPSMMVAALSGIAKAVIRHSNATANARLNIVLEGITADESHDAIANTLLASERAAVLLGTQAINHPQLSQLRFLAGEITHLTGARLGYLAEGANASGAWLAGAVPHRGPGGAKVGPGMDAQRMLGQPLKKYITLGLEAEHDCRHGNRAAAALRQAEFVISLTAYRTPAMDDYAHCLLPIAQFAETSGTYVNAAGDWQGFSAAVNPPGEARPAWKVLRVLANQCNLPEFDYASSEQIRKEILGLTRDVVPYNEGRWRSPDESRPPPQTDGLELVFEHSMYAIDPLLRRAGALQKANRLNGSEAIRINQRIADQLRLNAGEKAVLEYNGAELILPVAIDARCPDGAVLLDGTREAALVYGPEFGEVTLKPINRSGPGSELP